MTSYDRTIEALERLERFGIRLGLDTMRAVCSERGDPQFRFPVVHVAGTNGKGTTIAALEALAIASGRKTGAYTSPHLVDFRERIRIDGEPIGSDAVVAGWRSLQECIEARGMSYFEATTMMALEHLANSDVDLGLIEVGLGGRLDATNVVNPDVAVVSAIDLDHEAHLGGDRASIAREKAGIFKAGRPALVGIVDPNVVRPAIVEVAEEVGADVRFFEDEASCRVERIDSNGTRFTYSGYGGAVEISTPLVGEHFAQDVALALWVWEWWTGRNLDFDEIRAVLASLRPPGRSQRATWRGVDIVFDVAHNPGAIGALLGAIEASSQGRPAVVSGFLSDKAWPAMVRRLRRVCAPMYVCGLETAPANRRLDRRRFEEGAVEGVEWVETIADGLEQAKEAVVESDADFVLVTGSFHTVGEALVATGLAAPASPFRSSSPMAGIGVA